MLIKNQLSFDESKVVFLTNWLIYVLSIKLSIELKLSLVVKLVILTILLFFRRTYIIYIEIRTIRIIPNRIPSNIKSIRLLMLIFFVYLIKKIIKTKVISINTTIREGKELMMIKIYGEIYVYEIMRIKILIYFIKDIF